MRVLIIGGTAFIGPALVRQLVERGHEVAVFHRGQTRAELPAGVRCFLGDRHDLGARIGEFRQFRPAVVVDMIAFTEADAVGLIEAFRGVAERAVVISSADVYRAYGRFIGIESGPAESTPLAEDAALRAVLYPYRSQAAGPDDFAYSYDKIPVERRALADVELPATVLRLPMVHGPGDTHHRLWPYVSRMDAGRPAIVLDEKMARWKCPRGYVENVAAAIALAVETQRVGSRIYNVADAIAFTEADWIRQIGEVAGWRGEVMIVPSGRIPLSYRVDQSLDTDTSRLRAELGHNETVSLKEAIARTVAWERANPPPASKGIGLLDIGEEDALLEDLGIQSSKFKVQD